MRDRKAPAALRSKSRVRRNLYEATVSLFSVGVDGWSSASSVLCVLLHELSVIRRAVLTAMTESLEIWRMIKGLLHILK